MPTLLIPPSPGIFSATGLLTTDLKRDAARTMLRPFDELDPAAVEEAFAELERAGAEDLAREGIPADRVEFVRQVDMRYVGQSHELTLAAGDGLLERFHAEHDRVYGFAAPAEAVELVSVRLSSVGRIEKPPARTLEPGEAGEPKARREVYFAEAGGFVDCPIHDREALGAGAALAGPVVIEQFDSTTVVHPGFVVRVDSNGNLVIEKERA
jgi:N-methylhydantoinase A